MNYFAKMAKACGSRNTKITRSSGLIKVNFEEDYPIISRFDNTKLPTHKEVIGLFRNISKDCTDEKSISKVAQI